MVQYRSALLLWAVLLLYIAPALGADVVSFEQQGSTKEPFDVDGSISFQIPIENKISSSMRYTVALTLGPDKNDQSISQNFTLVKIVNAHSSGSAVFNVNFRNPKLSRGDLGKWASDKNDTTVWDRSWYYAEVKPLIGETKVLEGYDGHPNLMKAFFEYRNPGVTPAQGSNRDHYSYEVDVVGSYSENVSLKVGPSREGPWTELGAREYTTPGLSQRLNWSNNTLNFDFNVAYFKFEGRKLSKVFEGPFWPVAMQSGNASVAPPRDLAKKSFIYSLEVNSTKSIDVGLNVLDVSSKTFKLAGRASYRNATHWQKIEWTGVQPSAVADAEGRSSYYFTFYYVGSEMPFHKTEQYSGPDIVTVIFKNPRVAPENGSPMTPYNYSVEVETERPQCDVELQTTSPSSSNDSSKWLSGGVVTYDGSNKRLAWKDIKIDGDTSGMARYRFKCGESYSETYRGPEVRVAEIVGYVTPMKGVLQAFAETNDLYNFTYTAVFNNWCNGDELWVELLARAPNSSWQSIGEKKQYDPSKGNITWTKKPFSDVEFLGSAEFKFLVDGGESKVFKGPNIVAMYKGLDFEKISTGVFDYSASVCGSEDLTVDLIYSRDNEKWTESGKPETYSANSGWQKIVWKGLPPYNFYELEIKPNEAVAGEPVMVNETSSRQ